MAKITKLDDIEIYKEALMLAQIVYHLLKESRLSKEYGLCDQIKRAALSVAANIAEGYGRNTKKDFAQFLSVALGSVNEVIASLDFRELEFHIDTSDIKERYIILTKRIHSFRTYLLNSK